VAKLSPAPLPRDHRRSPSENLRVMAHVFYLSGARDLVNAGVDGFPPGRDAEMDTNP
jgi:hypothetical protein